MQIGRGNAVMHIIARGAEILAETWRKYPCDCAHFQSLLEKVFNHQHCSFYEQQLGCVCIRSSVNSSLYGIEISGVQSDTNRISSYCLQTSSSSC